MALRKRWFGCMGVLAMVVTLTGELKETRAQTLDEGWNVLEGKFRSGAGNLALGFAKGARVDPNDKNHTDAIDLLAKFYTYGVYLRKLELQPTTVGTRGDSIAKDFDAFSNIVDRDILLAKDRQAMQTFAEIFRDRVRVHALEVIRFNKARPIHKLHNARVLDEIAKLGQPQLADTLLTVLKDPQQTDGVRYYILKGLDTLIPRLQPQQQAKCAEALVEFLDQKKGPGSKAPQEELDGFRMLRRQAVSALAKIRTPAINDNVRPALVLARFAGNDESIQPPPRIDERVEAAYGLARMQAPKDKQYQADYAAGQIAKCLGAFAQAAEAERAVAKETRTHPWTIMAAQLQEGLTDLKKNSGTNQYVSRIADRGHQLLNQVIKREQIKDNEQTWWTSAESDPPSKELFQGAADSVIKPGKSEPVPEK